MRTITVTEKHKAVNEGRMSKTEFVRQMRQSYPMYISPVGTYDSTVQILKNKQMLFEEKEYEVDDTFKYSDDSLRRAIDIELEAMGLMSHGTISMEDQDKAKKKAIANLKKDPLHYYHLISGDSSKVNKHDKPVEVKKGNEVDTFNGMKKATLKEAKQNLAEGTRALVGYLFGDILTTTYNHYDGYPSNLGKGLMTHYNTKDKAEDIAMKGYITSMDPDTGDISATHSDPARKVHLDDDAQERAKEIAEEIDSMGADYGYIWDDETSNWVTIKNTGIRSMTDQIMDKLSMMNVYSGDKMNEVPAEEAVAEPTLKETLGGIVAFLKSKGAKNDSIKDFIKTHKDDIQGMSMDDVEDEYNNFLSVNTDYVDEKKLNEEGAEDANYPMEEAFKRYGIDMSKDVIVAEMDGGTPGLGGGQLDIGDPEPAALVAKRFEKHRLAAIAEYKESRDDREDQYGDRVDDMGDFPVMYEDGFYGDYTPEGTEHKLTYSEFEGVMYDIFQEPSGVSEKKGKDIKEEVDFDVFSDTIQVVGYPKTVEDALKIIDRYEKDREAPVSREEAKDLVADMRATDEDDFDRNITNLIVKAFNIKLKGVSEKKGKDHDGDGDIDSDDYMAAKDKAIKKAMGKEVNESVVKKNIKSIITKILEEEVINEAATNDLAKIADEYEDFGGLKPAVISLQNIVTEIESFYDKTREKIQKVYDALGNVTNDEGLKVGAFITPSIENAFKRDLKHIIKNQFTGGLSMPQVRRISQDDIDRGTVQQEAPKDTVFSPVNEKKNKNEK